MNQIIINVDDFQTRAALLEEDKLAEFFIERSDEVKVTGNIYKGKVANVLPGMESAFLDIGLEKNAFLYVKDLREFEEMYLDGIENSDRPIEDLLNVGDEVVVQILKDPRGTKGARVTTHYTIPGKYLVLMPNNDYIAISQKIKNDKERKRLEELLSEIKPDNMGFIIRTAAEGKNELHFEREVEYLVKKWHDIERKISRSKPGDIIYRDNELVNTVLRDIFSSNIDELVIDNEKKYWEIIDYINAFSESSMKTKIKLYNENFPIFETYGVNSQLDKALREVVWLECGGYLVIQRTEALVSIDVNTGKNTGRMNLEDTVFETNIEAAKEIPRQLRLRNMSGIIIIDFIDMRHEEDKIKVTEVLEEHLKKDRIKNNIIHFTDLGLIEMTRKRVGKPLSHYFQEECSHCKGTGKIKSKDSVINDVITEIKIFSEEKDVSIIKLKISKELNGFFKGIYDDFIKVYLKSKGKFFKVEVDPLKDNYDYEILLEV
ncbi:Rne/Rng family ribonuclease [uncultured Ilyobacter sp.]|uniref:Rne/Rng family ribonuclease n=1 Tax=uncultured Ilyobacter sp. TaxID=544433 RepID=UPI0029C69F62|nr:Rne/Rng family ribonuclease [uncultured Ilyobacter sp.]